MPRMSNIELFAAIRRDAAAGMSGRAIEERYRVGAAGWQPSSRHQRRRSRQVPL
jgi:hypothetical protein